MKSVAKLVAQLLIWVFFISQPGEETWRFVFSVLLAWNGTSGFPTLISLLFFYRASA